MRTEDDLRAALRVLERHAPDLSAVLPDATSPRHRRSRWHWVGIPVLAALAVTAVVIVPGKILKPTIGNEPAASRVTGTTAAGFLTAAAARLAAQPAGSGTYWQVVTREGQLAAAGPNSHPYAVQQDSGTRTAWYASAPKKQILATARPGQTPSLPTAGAIAAWRADGSPRLASGPFYAGLPVGQLWFGLQFYTVAQFQALPATVAGLKAAIQRSLIEPSHPVGATFTEPDWISNNPPISFTPGTAGYSRFIFGICVDLLDHEPVTPQVRAAALRVIATLPGVSLAGKVTDPLGRTGYAITMSGPPFYVSSGVIEDPQDMSERVVIAPSGDLLAVEWVAARLPAGVHQAPSSGAAPGPTKCPAGYPRDPAATRGLSSMCWYGQYTVTRLKNGTTEIRPEQGVVRTAPLKPGQSPPEPVLLNQPVLEVPPGTVLFYHALVSAGWTSTAPPPSATVTRLGD